LSSIRNLRYVALIEATTFLALLVATFINVRSAAGWDAKTTLLVLLGAVLPFGGYVVDRWLSRQTPASA